MTDHHSAAIFLTWTVYGTFLQGDHRGWRRRRKGQQLPQPHLAEWRRQRLKHPILLLNPSQAAVVESEIGQHCSLRQWKLWALAVRTNHVHAVVTARGYSDQQVREQLKAYATRGLRKHWPEFQGRPVWTALGDCKPIESADDLGAVVDYVTKSQDRMHLPKR